MWHPFSSTTRSLESDGTRVQTAASLLGGALAIAVVLWSTLAHVPIYVSATTAQVDTVTLPHHVQSVVEGLVVTSRLALGTRVSVGDILVELDSRPEQAELASLQAQERGIEAEVAAISAQVEQETRAIAVSKKLQSSTVREARLKREQSAPRARLSEERAALAAKATDGVFSEPEKRERATAARELHLAEDVLRAGADRIAWEQMLAVSSREVRLEELAREKARLVAGAATKAAAASALQVAIERRQIRAGAAGYLGSVSDLAVGAVVKPSDTLAIIVPAEDLKVIANMPAATGAGVLRSGQQARVRFPAFPWTQYGSSQAVVERVATQATDGTVRVELSLSGPGSAAPVQQGMLATVDVEVDRVTPFALMLRTLGARPARPLPPRQEVGDRRLVSQ